jgi:hypothetical protein
MCVSSDGADASAETYPFAQFLKDVDLDQSLLVESLLVANDLDSHKSAGLVVDTAHHLSEATLTEKVNNLISVCEVVAEDYIIIATVVIVSEVGGLRVKVTDMLLRVLGATEVDLLIIDDLASLEDVQVDHLQCLGGCDAFLGHSTLAQCVDITRRMLEVLAFGSELLHLFVCHQIVSIEVWIQVASSEHVGGALRSKHALHRRQYGRTRLSSRLTCRRRWVQGSCSGRGCLCVFT